jgi:hypothetical protein
MEERISTSYTARPKFSRCCRRDQVLLPSLWAPPKPLNQLLTHQADPHAKELGKHIRAYNSSFQIASSGADYQGGVLPYWGVGVRMLRMQVSIPHKYLCRIVFCPTRTTTLSGICMQRCWPEVLSPGLLS